MRVNNQVHVAVAVIEDSQGRILLSQRPQDAHQGGLWEFPGGKVEPGESLAQALQRELLEELGITAVTSRPLIRTLHSYSDKTVLLDVHRVSDFSGEAEGMEGQPLAWVDLTDIDSYPLPAADRPIVTALKLPATYLITGDDPKQPELFLQRLEQALQRGQCLLQLRAPDLSRTEFVSLAGSALERCKVHGALLLLNAEPEVVKIVGADGVHLNSRRLLSQKSRPLSRRSLVSASCHNREELLYAEKLGLDFAVLSPVLPTESHPGADTLGWDRFREIVESVSIPVYCLGGMSQDLIPQAWRCGGQGIAAIRDLWLPEVGQ